MKPTFSDLTPDQQATFGNGCTWVPDFIFTANCRQHDFGYCRGKALKDKIKADWDMCRLMWNDSFLWWHYAVTITYWLGITILPFSYWFFEWGRRYKTLDEIVSYDTLKKKLDML